MHPFRVDQIVTPVDFSIVSNNAVETATTFCKQHHAALVLIHVIEPHFFSEERRALELHIRMHNEASEVLRDMADSIRGRHGIEVKTIVLEGDPASRICAWAVSHLTDVIVAGRHGASGYRERFVGSNTYRIIKYAPCPVIIIPESFHADVFAKILFPIRLNADPLMDYSQIKPFADRSKSLIKIAALVDKNDNLAINSLRSLLARVQKNVHHDELASGVYLTDNFSAKIFEIIDEEQPDLIVMAPSFEDPEFHQDFVIGPFMQSVVNNSSIPVLCIRGHKESINTLGAAKRNVSIR